MALYWPKREVFLSLHPLCQVAGCRERTWDLHHMAGRRGPFLLDERYWMAVCRTHHNLIHSRARWARANGYLLGM
jgi:hypothetical protein